MRLLFLFCLILFTGCAGKPASDLTVAEEDELQSALDAVTDQIEYVIVDDQALFIKDSNLSTIQVVMSNKNQISRDGQVVFTSTDSLDDLDTEELLMRYIEHLLTVVQ